MPETIHDRIGDAIINAIRETLGLNKRCFISRSLLLSLVEHAYHGRTIPARQAEPFAPQPAPAHSKSSGDLLIVTEEFLYDIGGTLYALEDNTDAELIKELNKSMINRIYIAIDEGETFFDAKAADIQARREAGESFEIDWKNCEEKLDSYGIFFNGHIDRDTPIDPRDEYGEDLISDCLRVDFWIEKWRPEEERNDDRKYNVIRLFHWIRPSAAEDGAQRLGLEWKE